MIRFYKAHKEHVERGANEGFAPLTFAQYLDLAIRIELADLN